MKRVVYGLALGAAIVFHASGDQAQTPPRPQFRGGTDLVQVEVSVLDSKRHPVRGLTAADFTLFDRGVARPIDAFTEVVLPPRVTPAPGAAAWTREIQPDVVSNTAPAQEGRIVVILMDRSIEVGQPSLLARRIATRIVDELGPNDLGAIVTTSGGTTQNLTSDRARLLKTIARSNAGSQESIDALQLENSIAVGITWGPMNDGECSCGLCVLETIGRVAASLEPVERRSKALYFIGTDLILQSAGAPDHADIGCVSRLNEARNAMLTAVDRANLTVHSIDPSGLNVTGPQSRTSSNLAPGRAAIAQTQELADKSTHQEALKFLPRRTGGRAVMDTNDAEGVVPEILEESGAYYVLGFRPATSASSSPTAEDFRKIEVKVARKGVQVHARSGYTSIAPTVAVSTPVPAAGKPSPVQTMFSPEARAALASAISAPLPNSTVPLDLSAAVFDVPGSRRAMVALAVGLDPAAGSPGQPGAHEAVQMLVGAFDRQGRPVASAEQVVPVTWPTTGPSAPRRLDVLSHLDLPAGDYEIRVAIAGRDLARASSAFTFVTVPDFRKEPLSLSTIALGGGAGTSALKDDAVAALMAFLPSTQRTFTTGDRLVAFLRVYQVGAAQPVSLHMQVLDAAGTSVANQSAQVPASEVVQGASDHFVDLPLSGLAAGDYLLTVEASAGPRKAGRAVRFSVR